MFYNPNIDGMYPSSMPGVFLEVARCHCVANVFELPTLEGLEIVVRLCEGAKLGARTLTRFPSYKTLPHTVVLGYHGVNVSQQDRRNGDMVLRLENAYQEGRGVEEAKNKIKRRILVGECSAIRTLHHGGNFFNFVVPKMRIIISVLAGRTG